MFKSFAQGVNFFKLLCLIYIPISLATPIAIYFLKRENCLIVMDPSNSYHVTEYSPKKKRVYLYNAVAQNSVNAFLMRNPNGLDFPRLFEALFVGEAKKEAIRQLSGELKSFKDYKIHQKAEVLGSKIIPVNNQKAFIRVNGQLIRAYINGLEKANYTLNFEMVICVKFNKNFATNRKYPFIVSSLKYKQQVVK